MKKRKKENKVLGPPEDLGFKYFEVTAKECNYDTSKMIKKFTRRTRKEEILKPFYRRLLYWETSSQKKRRKRLKSVYEWRKNQKIVQEEDKKD